MPDLDLVLSGAAGFAGGAGLPGTADASDAAPVAAVDVASPPDAYTQCYGRIWIHNIMGSEQVH